MVSKAVQTAWQINKGMNQKLLEHLTPEGLSVRTPSKSDTVAEYLAHLTETKKWWGKHLNEKGVAHLPSLLSHAEGKPIVSTDLPTIKAVFAQTDATILKTANAAADKGRLPYSSVDVYLIHQMIHDAHHRGQILLTLRTAGHDLPDEEGFWGGWWTDQQEN